MRYNVCSKEEKNFQISWEIHNRIKMRSKMRDK